MYDYVLFDLDGTLFDTHKGVFSSMRYGLSCVGIDDIDDETLTTFLGPPLVESFGTLNLSPEDMQTAMSKYREQYAAGDMFECELYPGMLELIRKLKGNKKKIAVASNKPLVYVNQILERFDILRYFDAVGAAPADGEECSKADIIRDVLDKLYGECEESGPRSRTELMKRTCMVGDRKYDLVGAKEVGIPSIGVTYGFGKMDELKAYGATHIVGSVARLEEMLLRGTAGAKAGGPGQARPGCRPRYEERQQDGDPHKPDPAAADSATLDGKPAKPPGMFRQMTVEPKKPVGFAKIWYVAAPVLIAWILKMLGQSLVQMVIGALYSNGGLSDAAKAWLIVDGTQEVDGVEQAVQYYSANSAAIMTLVGTLLGGIFLWVLFAKTELGKARREIPLEHGLTDSVPALVFGGAAVLGIGLGCNIFVNMAGIAAMDAQFASTSQMQFAVNMPLGLVLYVIVAPLAEEMAFRGILYNRMRRYWPVSLTLIITGFIFGFYHGNSVQGMFAFVMGLLFGYLYEYTGNFLVPLIAHAASNLAAFLLGSLAPAALINKTACIIAYVIGIAGFVLFELMRKGKIVLTKATKKATIGES